MTSATSRWFVVLGTSIFVFLFLWAFQPFGLFRQFIVSPMEAALGYAVITFLVITLYVFGWNNTLARYYGERWTVGKHLVVIFASVSLIGIVNGFYVLNILNESYLAQNGPVGVYVMQFVYTHAVGLFPVVLVLLIFEVRERNYYEQQSDLIQTTSSEGIVQEKMLIEIVGDNSSERIEIQPSMFLFARSSGNYVELHYLNGEETSKALLRLTLTGLMDQLTEHQDWIFQTHRSYVVNLRSIEHVAGNAQGYTLMIKESNEGIPVSRGKIAAFNAVMNSI